VNPRRYDLSLTQTLDNPRPNVGQTITFTLTVHNAGPDDAAGVAVTDHLPAGLTFDTSTASLGGYDPATGVWSVGGLANGGTATLQLKAVVTGPLAVQNAATLVDAGAGSSDTNPGNNQSGASVSPIKADLVIHATVDNPHPFLGQDVTYTVTVTNPAPGTDAATGVVVSAILPAGVRFEGATSSEGTYDPATGLWTIDTIPVGATATLKIRGRVSSSSIGALSTRINGARQFDPDSANNQATVAAASQGGAGLSGTVFDDRNNNGLTDPGEPGLAGTRVVLSGRAVDGSTVSLVGVTDARGDYHFDGLMPGTYSLAADATAGRLGGLGHSGTAGGRAGTDRVDGIVLAPGVQASGYGFATLQPASLSGVVFADVHRNGLLDARDYGVAHVVVTLTGTDDHGQAVRIATSSADDGSFAFASLRPGTYALAESRPAIFGSGPVTVGTQGGTPGRDAIRNIVVVAGTTGHDNGFAVTARPDCRLTPVAAHIRGILNNLIHRREVNAPRFDHFHPRAGAALAQGLLPRNLQKLAGGPNLSYYLPSLAKIPNDLARSSAVGTAAGAGLTLAAASPHRPGPALFLPRGPLHATRHFVRGR